MKASVTLTKELPPHIEELIKKYQESLEDTPWYYLNLWAIPQVAEAADKFITKAKTEMDNAMKGWKPVADGTETHYQIFRTEFSYTRHYTK